MTQILQIGKFTDDGYAEQLKQKMRRSEAILDWNDRNLEKQVILNVFE